MLPQNHTQINSNRIQADRLIKQALTTLSRKKQAVPGLKPSTACFLQTHLS